MDSESIAEEDGLGLTIFRYRDKGSALSRARAQACRDADAKQPKLANSAIAMTRVDMIVVAVFELPILC